MSTAVEKIVEEALESQKEEFSPGNTKIAIGGPCFGKEELESVIETVLSGWITGGKRVEQFEKQFAEVMSCKHAVATNSGSSANLMVYNILSSRHFENPLQKGDEVITSALTWPTSCFPITQVGARPVFVDVDQETYCINPNEIEKAITDKTKIISPVHVLGHPADMTRIMEIAEAHNLIVMEDACECYRAMWDGKVVGSFGDISTVSFFVSHIMATGEGGMILTDNEDYATIARSLRAFGRVPPENSKLYPKLSDELKGYHPGFLFSELGYSMKMLDIQAAFGIEQLKKMDELLKARVKIADYYTKSLKKFEHLLQLPITRKEATHTWFGYPITIKDGAGFAREEITDYLLESKIETRPLLAGNITLQPALEGTDFRTGDLSVSNKVFKDSFYIGSWPGIRKEMQEFLVEKFSTFLEKY